MFYTGAVSEAARSSTVTLETTPQTVEPGKYLNSTFCVVHSTIYILFFA